jgi:hypothetical protein
MGPLQWLLELNESDDGYQRLLAAAGGDLVVAAYRLAVARCGVAMPQLTVPTAIEISAAAHEIAIRLGLPMPVPRSRLLAEYCEAEGLPVL